MSGGGSAVVRGVQPVIRTAVPLCVHGQHHVVDRVYLAAVCVVAYVGFRIRVKEAVPHASPNGGDKSAVLLVYGDIGNAHEVGVSCCGDSEFNAYGARAGSLV